MAYSKHIYAPKPGDEVKWPNGLTMTYDDATELIAVTGLPEDDILFADTSHGVWHIGVTE
jgi:hypothetical protein